MSTESPDHIVGSSGEVALWRAVIDQLLHDATCGATDPDEAREFFWRFEPDLALICDFANLDPSALCRYAEDVIRSGPPGVRLRTPPRNS